MAQAEHPRSIRSFVTRSGRITDAQSRALETSWPKFGIEFSTTPLDLDAVFGRHAPRVCEIGFGNGEHLVELATANPQRDYLGIEVHRPGVGRLLLSLEERELRNVRVICHDAVEVLTHQIPPGALDELLILFPDPWPKKRHHKRRLIQPAFVELATARLKRGGIIRLATDWEPYAQHMLEVLRGNAALENLSRTGDFVERPEERSATRFERRGARLGHNVRDLAFRVK